MMSTEEKVAYLRGLIDATDFDSKEQKKLFIALTDLLRSIVRDVDENMGNIDNVDAHLLEVDEDLAAVENIIYDGDSAKEDDSEDDGDYSFDEGELEDYDDDDDDFDDDESEEQDSDGEEMYEIECPACHETIYLQESIILEGGVDCPNCGEPLEFDVQFEDED